MKKTIFEITKMDCPSEENLIRMKLDGISSIANLDFDIPNRKLTIFHKGQLDQIEKSVLELNLGGGERGTAFHKVNPLQTVEYLRKSDATPLLNCAYLRISMQTIVPQIVPQAFWDYEFTARRLQKCGRL